MGTLLRLLLRRLAALPLMILGVTLLVFIVLQAAPGDQATSALGEGASDAAKDAIPRGATGSTTPLVIQYFRFLGKPAHAGLRHDHAAGEPGRRP